MNCVVCFGDCLIFANCIIFCVYWLSGFQTHILTVASYLLLQPNNRTMDCVVCFGDCLVFAKCIIFCVHWLPGFRTPILTVANKLHIYYLKQIIGQWIVWPVLATTSCLLIVLAMFISSGLPRRERL